MTVRYDEPPGVAIAANLVIRWLAELGISIAGTRALRVRGRTTGKLRTVVVNVLLSMASTIWSRPAATRSGRAMFGRPEQSRSDRAGVVAGFVRQSLPTRRSRTAGGIWTGGTGRSRATSPG